MARTRFAVALVLTACTALPAPALAHVTFTQDEITAIDPPSRDELRRTKDRLMAADAAIRDHINRSMHALMQGHSNGFALFDTWYRARDARLRDEAAQREVIANICGKGPRAQRDVPHCWLHRRDNQQGVPPLADRLALTAPCGGPDRLRLQIGVGDG